MTTAKPKARRPRESGSQGPSAFKTKATRSRRRWLAVKIGAALVVVAAVGYALQNSGPEVDATQRVAMDFTLPTSEGGTLTLSDLRGRPVILYFNEGAGCASCIYQMAAIEAEPGFQEAGILVVPVVMDPVDQIRAAAEEFGVLTPFLIDDGTVSDAYGSLGTGMHPNLPGHGFVLIDADGNQVWKGDYPSMWLEPVELVDIAQSVLAETGGPK